MIKSRNGSANSITRNGTNPELNAYIKHGTKKAKNAKTKNRNGT
jgi:hypothetical protein